MTELQLQAQCFTWFWNTFPEHRQMLFSVNNNSVNAIKGQQMKQIGVVKGVSDFILITWAKVHFIELKTETGFQKPEQKTFEAKVLIRQHDYYIVRDFKSFQELCFKLLKIST